MVTSENAEDTTWRPSMLSAAGSPVNLFRVRVNGKLKPICVGSGRSSPASSLSYDPSTLLWKTCQGFFTEEWEMSLLIWPKQGMMRSGTVYLRQPLALHIKERELSLWPTPGARDWKGASDGQNLTYSRLTTYLHHNFGHTGRTTYPNPSLTEVMMGFPEGWIDLGD